MLKTFGYVMDIGEQMLISGAEVHRVEESIHRMCCACGAARVDVFIITSCMIVTIHTSDGQTYTQTRRVTTTNNINYERIHHLNELSREICARNLTNTEIEEKIQKILSCKKFPLWLEFVSYALIAGSFTLFFGGNLIESVISFFVGACVRLGILFCDKKIPNKIFVKFFSTVIATFLTFLTVKLGWINTVDKVIVGNIMSLIPGIGLTNALRDLFTGDSIAGLLRSIEAVLTALAIAAGYFLVAVLGGIIL